MKRVVGVLPDLGGLGKSTLSEMLVAYCEIAGVPVIACDGDESVRGLELRRGGRETIQLGWSLSNESKKAGIIAATPDDGVAVLDFGATALQQLSATATLSDLLRHKTDGVEVTAFVIGEASKPGNAESILRLRNAYPDVDYVFVKNMKSGDDFGAFVPAVEGMPAITLEAMEPACMNWLTGHGRDATGARRSLADVIAEPLDGYAIMGSYFAAKLGRFMKQAPLEERFGADLGGKKSIAGIAEIFDGNDDWGPLAPSSALIGDGSDARMKLFLEQSRALRDFMRAKIDPDAAAFDAQAAAVARRYISARDALM